MKGKKGEKKPYRFLQWVAGIQRYRYFTTREKAEKARDKTLRRDVPVLCGRLERRGAKGNWKSVEV